MLTEVNFSESSVNKLLELLNTVPVDKRDITWNQLWRDISRIRSIMINCKVNSYKRTTMKTSNIHSKV